MVGRAMRAPPWMSGKAGWQCYSQFWTPARSVRAIDATGAGMLASRNSTLPKSTRRAFWRLTAFLPYVGLP
ncbi:hypothetical protein RGR602_PC01227 (plasmid) [Rhizobium gallicum bv. gallicum R602sp]|uniref:Uncharacterized protein n=1 Tax=Rhizobium gallicum bv. gallicum R602sp TaxID=1041138 RepID=A0A0B4XFK1_9HYPH|nr:hypothetical protein RGR602_PC01227 [Rhizobium gallicum bv. gallicum R602sp]TDW27343.1 hypothetical protein EV128_11171 [Rhizobium azibense]